MQNAWTRYLILGLALSALAGCGPNNQEQSDKINDAAVAIGSKTRYDDAVADCNRAIEIGPNPQAYYLRGRAEQERPKPDSSITAADFDKAGKDYKSALGLHPDPDLEAHICDKMADLAFAQEQYATALREYTRAIDHLDSAEWRAPALYQLGVSQQRLGYFPDADATFQRVIDDYPDTELAQLAKEHLGARAFYVELGEYTNPADTASAMTMAGSLGVKPESDAQPDGSRLLRAGPFDTYADAAKTRNSVIVQFPGAAVTP